MKINHNISAIIANGKLKTSENRLAASVERLSSGLKINHASDDPAGMAISQKMRTQIRGLGRASDNSSDGISVIETAEGALTEAHSILQRMRELAVQSSNDTYSEEDRAAIQTEVKSLTQEVDRIASDTQFNNVTLLSGELDYRGYTNAKEVSVVTFTDSVATGKYKIRVMNNAERAQATGGNVSAITQDSAGSLTINGESVTFKAGETAEEAFQKVRDLANRVGVSVYAEAGGLKYISDDYGSKAKIEFACENDALAAALGMTEGVKYGTDVKISTDAGFANTTSYAADGTRVVITDRNGFSIELDIDADAPEGQPITLDIMDIGSMVLQIGANRGETMDLKIPPTTAYALNIEHMNFLSQQGSSNAIETLDKAIGKVSSVRSSLGAYQNRLEHTISSLDIAEENMTSALSRIEDVDMAEEMSEYTAANVLQQAGTSVLAQANDVPQTVLQLLG